MRMPDETACSVKNMTCAKFLSKKQCKGIAVGWCGSRYNLLAKPTPSSVIFSLLSRAVTILKNGYVGFSTVFSKYEG